ncbi:MAG: hypothetical protein ACKVW3_05895 [Phycisphaerales bacterium]
MSPASVGPFIPVSRVLGGGLRRLPVAGQSRCQFAAQIAGAAECVSDEKVRVYTRVRWPTEFVS